MTNTLLFLGAFVLLVFLAIWGKRKLVDIKAIQFAKSYCRKNGLEYKDVKIFPKHYGLYFRKAAKSYYANYNYDLKNSAVWKNGSPIEKINA